MRRCPLCLHYHENKVDGCPPLEEQATDILKDDSFLQPENPPYVQAAIESAKAARELLEVERAAELLKQDGIAGDLQRYKCFRCRNTFYAKGEHSVNFCEPCIKASQ